MKQITIAHVGSNESHFNDDDRDHIDFIFKWIWDKDEFTDILNSMLDNRIDDFIDLNDGRDFLAENYKYDIVILHNIYAAPYNGGYGRYGLFNVSKFHDKDNWINRLVSTGAALIFAFGDNSKNEVDGSYLGSIPGYIGPEIFKDHLHIYEKSRRNDLSDL